MKVFQSSGTISISQAGGSMQIKQASGNLALKITLDASVVELVLLREDTSSILRETGDKFLREENV